MKNLNFNSMSLLEMNTIEMQETNGGFGIIILAACAVALILPYCSKVVNLEAPLPVDYAAADSSAANSIALAKRYNVPIGY